MHDEIILEGPEKDAAVAYKIVQECMEKPFAPRKVFVCVFASFFFFATFPRVFYKSLEGVDMCVGIVTRISKCW